MPEARAFRRAGRGKSASPVRRGESGPRSTVALSPTLPALPDVLLRQDSLDWPMLRGISHFCVAHPESFEPLLAAPGSDSIVHMKLRRRGFVPALPTTPALSALAQRPGAAPPN